MGSTGLISTEVSLVPQVLSREKVVPTAMGIPQWAARASPVGTVDTVGTVGRSDLN